MVVGACTPQRAQGGANKVDRAAIETALIRGGEAWASGDVALLDKLLSPTFTHTDIHGKFQDRAEWLAYAKTRAGSKAESTIDDIAVRQLGDVAIVTARNTVTDGGSRRALSITVVMAKHNGAWLRETAHVTAIS
jgi:ketosteroid isomerase-like protein